MKLLFFFIFAVDILLKHQLRAIDCPRNLNIEDISNADELDEIYTCVWKREGVLNRSGIIDNDKLKIVVECENKQNDKLKSPNLITQDQDPVATNISNNNSSTAVDTVVSSISLSDLNSTTSLTAALH
ncbi:hypothetical protein RN001_000684 [Aquatica leii]|uniref:Uncharacterized protein n=1 Tax=Aquatica leii TaxID=1421715 RepID=A0AAN7SQM3_9COLE|nr:hypothetical protein RN001_000684 [Aquatica leii]